MTDHAPTESFEDWEPIEEDATEDEQHKNLAVSANWVNKIKEIDRQDPWRGKIDKMTIRQAQHLSRSARIRIWNGDVVGWHLDVMAGRIVPTQAQLIAAGRMLNKTLPDLKAMEITGTVTHRHELSREALDARMRAMGLDPQQEWQKLQENPAIQ